MLLNELLLLELRYEDLPETDYGFWIDDMGKLIPVDDEEHGEVAEEELSKVSPLEGDPYDEAYDRGWIRVILNPKSASKTEIEFGPRVSPKAKRQLAYLLRLFKDEIQAIWAEGPKTDKMFRIAPMAAGQAINWINQQ